VSGLGRLQVDGSVNQALISVESADGRIGSILVKGNWKAASVVAGIAAGADLALGTADDVAITTGNRAKLVSQIAKIQINGGISGTTQAGDSFAFAAQRIGTIKAGWSMVKLTTGAGNNNLLANDSAYNFGPFSDIRAREVAVV
jgi:hypothetical protein